MLRLVLAAVVVAAYPGVDESVYGSRPPPTSGTSSPHPIISWPQLVGFASDSLILGFDLIVHLMQESWRVIKAHIPPATQQTIDNTIDELFEKKESLRVRFNVPSCAELKDKADELLDKMKEKYFEISAKINQVTEPIQKPVDFRVASFEKAFPKFAGAIPTEFLDRLLFLVYVFFVLRFITSFIYFFLCLFCRMCCCWCCNRRKNGADMNRKRAGRYAEKKKK